MVDKIQLEVFGSEGFCQCHEQPGIPQPGILPEKPKLSICVIVRDEGEMLPRCLRSFRNVAHELIVVDTGSQDSTIQVAKDFGAKVFHYR